MAGKQQRTHKEASNIVPSKDIEQRFWTYVWTIKLIVLFLMFFVLFAVVGRFIL